MMKGLIPNVVLILCVLAIGFWAHHRESIPIHFTCVEVEKLKAASRATENQDYSHRFRDLRLLHIKATPAILRIIKHDHDKRLALYSPKHCA